MTMPALAPALDSLTVAGETDWQRLDPRRAAVTTATPGGADHSVEWSLVARLRAQASERLSRRLGHDRVDAGEQHSLGRAIIADLLSESAAQAVASGQRPWERDFQSRLGQAVFDALFRLGRLQPLVDDDTIENIIVTGCDNVWLERCDGSLTRGPAVAQTDAELIDFLSFIASRSEVNARSFSEAEPRLHLRLDGGARLAAVAWVTPRPSVVIRRHRLHEVTLDDLVARETLTPAAASLLAAAVRARRSIVVAGSQGAGKTTLIRALCAEIPPDEAIGTFETEYELHLHEMTDRHPIVHAWEARPGSGEREADGRRAGEFTLDDALYDSFRFNLSRQIVGEVRGAEVLAMVKAMQSGSGSLSTTHADSAEGTIQKLITCAMEAGPHVTVDYATRVIADTIDLVVFVERAATTASDGTTQRFRWVSQILAVTPGELPRGYAVTRLFWADPGERVARPVTFPDHLGDLTAHGFDLAAYRAENRLGAPALSIVGRT
ncbi:MAG: CpaF/VirB11 family protein [Propionibacteriaceae bacterium]|jgi:Flp pilus assembly CpaF family ATPase|nr:CpaF/VirB11 family protein [Propionibacteriaceae bacterium]